MRCFHIVSVTWNKLLASRDVVSQFDYQLIWASQRGAPPGGGGSNPGFTFMKMHLYVAHCVSAHSDNENEAEYQH